MGAFTRGEARVRISVGFVGVGTMGTPMIDHFSGARIEVLVFDCLLGARHGAGPAPLGVCSRVPRRSGGRLSDGVHAPVLVHRPACGGRRGRALRNPPAGSLSLSTWAPPTRGVRSSSPARRRRQPENANQTQIAKLPAGADKSPGA